MRPFASVLSFSLLAVSVAIGQTWGAAGPAATRPPGGLSVLRVEADGWTASYSRLSVSAASVTIEGVPHTLYQAVSSPADSGSPQLPVEVLSVGIPSGGVITAELINPVYEETANQLIAPVPARRGNADGEAIAVYLKDRKAYAADRFFPGREVWTDPPFMLRRQRIATVHLAPVQYNPSSRILRRLVSGTVRIHLQQNGISSSVALPNVRDPYFEEVYRGLISNYEQAKQWRVATVRADRAGADPSRDWFLPGRQYIRIPVAADGWYRVTKSDLTAGGVQVDAIDTTGLSVWFRGAEIPIVVRPDTSIEFFTQRNSGDSTSLDFYTDTSATWLTWGGAPGKRFVSGTNVTGTPAFEVPSSPVSRHFEENTDYYEGTGDAEISNNGPVPGEGWAWEYYYPGTVSTHSFEADSLDLSSAPATLRVRMFSTTLNYTTPNHRARFWVNDSLVGDATFDGRKEGRLNADFPSRWLKGGTNSLRIQSLPPPASPVNQFYLDWFELDYTRLLRAEGDQLIFVGPPSPAAGIGRFIVAGFSSPNIDVFDLTHGRRIGGGTVTGGPGAGYSIAFQDSFSASCRYAVVAPPGPKTPLPLSKKVFTDIRAGALGADYIIITHHDFLGAAQQLAAHRQSAGGGGVRVRVVDVQDIYDEFNYGVMNAEKIKSFLRYAYDNWPSPAPACLLILGDASWDYHHYMASTIKTNFVPAYGVPAGDNWYGCFDSIYTFLPSLLIGRIPAQDPVQAARTVAKVIGYDASVPAEWTKSFLFISGGTTPAEQRSFDGICDATINNFVIPPPVGGAVRKVYKTTPNTIDGENKELLKDIVKQGVVFMNFLGHSGGRIWGVDIGSPNDLENTNGRLPFVSSVSCNVGAFAEPSNNVLSEDFVLADNRGAIAMWASSSLGHADVGSALVNLFLQGVRSDSVRGFGALTTTARFRLWQGSNSDYVTVASVNLNPLLGDPLSKLALPLKPDLAVTTSDISLDSPLPSTNDTALTVSVNIHNYGLVPADSVGILLTDLYSGQSTPLLNGSKIAPTMFRDSLAVRWRGTSQVGKHTFQVTVDPAGLLDEVTKTNNTASSDQYVYANLLAIIRPLKDMVVAPGPQLLRVSSPIGVDSASMHVVFELDTVPSFSSPFLMTSGEIMPGPASGEWTTPSLTDGRVYHWRARTVTGSVVGAWVMSSFSTSASLPAAPLVRWRESTASQFGDAELRQASVTDSGVTIGTSNPIRLFVRSVGNRGSMDRDYYSMLQVNQQTMQGLWWVNGSAFMAMRVDAFTGIPGFQAFDVAGQAVQADSLVNFIGATPQGNYIGITVIFDGRTNVSPALRAAVTSLGSTLIDSVQPGDAWSIIARKGTMTPLEHWSRDGVTADSLQVPNYYSHGSGSVTSAPLPMPQRWDSFRWTNRGVPGTTDQRVVLLGVRGDGSTDTLRTLPKDSTSVNLTGMNAITADPAYVTFRAGGLLTSKDALVTPLLREWSADFEPPADLAVSQRTLSSPKITLKTGFAASVTLAIYNIGYRTADSVRVSLSVIMPDNRLQPIAYAATDSIPAGGSRTLTIPFDLQGLPPQFTLQARVAPPSRQKELVYENNTTLYNFAVTGGEGGFAAKIQVFSDGVQLMEGDYVAARPRILVRLADVQGTGNVPPVIDFFVDNVPVVSSVGGALEKTVRGGGVPGDELTFFPVLPAGAHELKIRVSQLTSLGTTDSVLTRIMVSVVDDYRILQLFNFPNPFQNETWFTFVLTGPSPPEDLTVRIFTAAGRRIRELRATPGSLQVGFNRLYWDGRDEEGDEVSNGYYFYKVELKGGGKTQTAIGKVVRVR